MSGAFDRPAQPNLGAERVSVLFVFRHLTQEHGWDAIPKLQLSGVKDFDNLFRDALGELSNVSRYETFTEHPDDVNDPKRRQQLEDERASVDYVIAIDFLEESSFKQQFLSATVTTIGATVIPAPYSWDYTISANVSSRRARVGSYQRKATLTNWIETFLVFVYPFHPLDGKREEIFSESLHDLFKQIEAEKVLK